MKRKRKYGLGSTIATAGSLIPMDPASKAAVTAAGSILTLMEDNSGLPEVNQNFMTKRGGQIIMDLGGEVLAYVEKDEVVRTKNEGFRVGGGTHEDGNDTLLLADPGTEVYSNQISVKGKTMADMEEERMQNSMSRARRMKKIMKKLEKDPENFMVKAGAHREIERIKMQEKKDMEERLRHMEVQEILGEGEQEEMASGGRLRLGCGGRIKKMALGGDIDPAKARVLKRVNEMKIYDEAGAKDLADMYGFYDDGTGNYIMDQPGQTSVASQASNHTVAGTNVPTFDDAVGDAGGEAGGSGEGTGGKNQYDPYVAAARTQGYSNAAATVMSLLNYKPIPDFSAGYGQRGLAENSKAMSTAGIERDMRESDLASSRAGGLSTIRNVSRGANEYMAKALGLETTVQDQAAEVSNQYVKNINDTIGRRGQLFDAQDQFMSRGRQTQFDEQEKADDNLIENFATSAQDIGLTEQNVALYKTLQDTRKNPESFKRALEILMFGKNGASSKTSSTQKR